MARAEESRHLSELLKKKSGSVDAQIVFCDIVSYSKRKSTVQKSVINRFQLDIRGQISDASRDNVDFFQSNNLNLLNDTIILPTGDGAAIAFTFGGVQALGLGFARGLLKRIYDQNESEPCDAFKAEGWCNCHDHYLIRIGVNEGKAIIFEDVNGNVNIAGTPINDAARIMNIAEASQLLLGELAYTNLIDMSDDPSLDRALKAVGETRVKHGKSINLYQFVGIEKYDFISSELPIALKMSQVMDPINKRFGFDQMPDNNDMANKEKLLTVVTAMASFVEQITGSKEVGKTVIDQKPK